MLKTKFLRRL